MTSAPRTDFALRLDELSLNRGNKRLFQSLSLEMSVGESGVIVGANGSGKTSLALAICGLLKPRAGSVKVLGRVAFCPQDPCFAGELSCREYLRQLAALGSTAPRLVKTQVEDALNTFGLHDWCDHKIGSLSRGWQQRLNLARAWLGGPELVVLDEPHTALDPEGIALLKEAIESQRMTALLLSPPGTPTATLAPTIMELEVSW
ncbi:MAG: hypothetical protein COB96_03115 [Planctomycetota bacterium]|jgi:ABC-2 type transport system ATP-binding protein|nr:MAG: hypothetical protein COB96_03115 [Planctomycetota bacterium]